jgi:hypothetical protein
LSENCDGKFHKAIGCFSLPVDAKDAANTHVDAITIQSTNLITISKKKPFEIQHHRNVMIINCLESWVFIDVQKPI